jgi:pyruvate-formate lyase-activating enzyme
MNREYVLIWAKKYCNNDTLTDTEDFSVVLDILIETLERAGVTSESLGGLSQSFGETYLNIQKILSPYKRVKMI